MATDCFDIPLTHAGRMSGEFKTMPLSVRFQGGMCELGGGGGGGGGCFALMFRPV